MAERRMFNKSLIFSNAFTQLSKAAQLLYMYLNLMADDDGICANSRAVYRMCGSTTKQRKELVDGLWLLEFPDGEVAIRHWHIHNQIRKDRYKPSICTHVAVQLQKGADGAYVLTPPGCQTGNQLATQDSSDQDSIAQISINQGNIEEVIAAGSSSEPLGAACDDKHIDYEKILEYYRVFCPYLMPCDGLTELLRRKIRHCHQLGYTPGRLMEIFLRANRSDFLAGVNDRSWQADLGWLMEPQHLAAVMSGKYDTWA